jgi:hypothetical protein
VSAVTDSTLSTDAWHMLRILLWNQQSLQLQFVCLFVCLFVSTTSCALTGFGPQSFHYNFVEESFMGPSTDLGTGTQEWPVTAWYCAAQCQADMPTFSVYTSHCCIDVHCALLSLGCIVSRMSLCGLEIIWILRRFCGFLCCYPHLLSTDLLTQFQHVQIVRLYIKNDTNADTL